MAFPIVDCVISHTELFGHGLHADLIDGLLAGMEIVETLEFTVLSRRLFSAFLNEPGH
jgi:hypothetical protein